MQTTLPTTVLSHDHYLYLIHPASSTPEMKEKPYEVNHTHDPQRRNKASKQGDDLFRIAYPLGLGDSAILPKGLWNFSPRCGFIKLSVLLTSRMRGQTTHSQINVGT